MNGARTGNASAGGLGLAVLALLLGYSPLLAQLAPAPPPVSQSPSLQPGLAPPPPVASSPHLDASPSVIRTPRDATRGRITLAVDVTPKPGMRVYAPGNKGYAGVVFDLDGPLAAALGRINHPKPESYLFEPLSERVLVYSAPFRLTRELKTGTGELPQTVRGTLEYQACDDKVCYRPQTLSLTWRIAG